MSWMTSPVSDGCIAEFQLCDVKMGIYKGLDRVPFVIRGAVRDWPACTTWKGDAGINRLEMLAGHADVQVMVSEAGVYHGDMKQRTSETMPFSRFLRAAQMTDGRMPQHLYLAQATISDGTQADGESSASLLHNLAADIDFRQLLALLTDEDAHSINLWMQHRCGSSSLHHDPYENLLCVVCGSKTVHCFSPEAAPSVNPLPLWGESSNHSSLNIAAPDLARHPQCAVALESMLTAELEAGDAIHIPEGWWHQIDSAAGTIAINIWWRSAFDKLLGSHMDSYYLRRALQSLTETHKARLLKLPVSRDLPPQNGSSSSARMEKSLASADGSNAKRQRYEQSLTDDQKAQLLKSPVSKDMPAQHGSFAQGEALGASIDLKDHDNAKPPVSHAMPAQDGSLRRAAAVGGAGSAGKCKALSLTHAHKAWLLEHVSGDVPAKSGCHSNERSVPDGIGRSNKAEAAGVAGSEEQHKAKRQRAEHSSRHEHDTRPDSLWGELKDMQHFSEQPAEHLMRHLEKMLEERPAELVELLLHRLSPAFAELLTSKLEEHAAQPDGQHGMEVQKLMQKLYDLAGNASAFLDRLVEQKEAFAREACMAALEDATGIYEQQNQSI